MARSAVRLGLASCSILLLGSLASAQGETGFLRGKGNTDVVLSYSHDQYDQFWVGNTKMAMAGVGTVTRQTGNLYAAYGLTDELDLILNASYVVADATGTAGFPTESDPQNLVLAGLWRIYEHNFSDKATFSFLLLPGISFPMTDYQNNSVTAIGDGSTDLFGHLVAQVRTPRGYFAALEAGYDLRGGSTPDQVPINFTLGGTIANRLTLTPFVSLVDSLWGTDIGPPGTNYFPANQEDYLRAGIGAYWRFHDHFGLTGMWRTTLDGKNTGDVETFSVGLVFKVF